MMRAVAKHTQANSHKRTPKSIYTCVHACMYACTQNIRPHVPFVTCLQYVRMEFDRQTRHVAMQGQIKSCETKGQRCFPMN